MTLRTILGLALAALLAGGPPARAGGFLDGLLGSPGATPPNPFASNYASSPPPPEVRAQREDRAARASRPERERGPVPPARIPE